MKKNNDEQILILSQDNIKYTEMFLASCYYINYQIDFKIKYDIKIFKYHNNSLTQTRKFFLDILQNNAKI